MKKEQQDAQRLIAKNDKLATLTAKRCRTIVGAMGADRQKSTIQNSNSQRTSGSTR